MNHAPVPFLDLKAAYAELKAEIDAAVARTLASGHYLLGGELDAFEQAYAAYTETEHCVGVGNGLEALVLSLRALDVGPGDEVVVPANTFIATWLAVSQVGAVPVPVEPLDGVWTMDAGRVEAALTPRTKALLPVHLYGQPADLDPLLDLARAHGLRVLEDAAQAHGARYRGRCIGGHGDLAAWSFYPGKNLGCLGDGGAVTTRNPELADRLRMLRNYGAKAKYHHEAKGHNSRLDDIQAAVLRAKLAHLDEWNQRRAAVAETYRSCLSDLPELGLPQVLPGNEPVWHLFAVEVPQRDRVQALLKERGVETLIHYPIPPHLSGAYASDRDWGRFPITERAAGRLLSLPMGPHLALEQAARAAGQLREVLRGLSARP